MIEVEIWRIVINEMCDHQVVVLKEKDGERTLPILIGIMEIFALQRAVEGMIPPRPMTHDLLASVIEKLGATVERLVISDLKNHTFYGTLVISVDGRTVNVDCRPSDGMVLAAKAGVPIFAEGHVLEMACQE